MPREIAPSDYLEAAKKAYDDDRPADAQVLAVIDQAESLRENNRLFRLWIQANAKSAAVAPETEDKPAESCPARFEPVTTNGTH